MAGNALRCESVTKFYGDGDHELKVLDEIDFEVAAGEFVSLLGPSGCGKSTLLRIIEGLIPTSAGRVTLGERVISGPGPDRGFVFQSDSLLPWRTVERNVGIGLEIIGVSRSDQAAEVRRLLEVVGLSEFAAHYPHQLSGGMRQRANLARALATDPDVLLMDEPFGALDAQTRELMQAELLRLWSSARKTVIFVTHSIEEAVFLSDRVIVMSSRPGAVRAEFAVDFPRPRDPSVRRTPEATELGRHIWEELRGEAVAAFQAERVL
jgi:NitT/TauT family transport system ATP-binding protein